MKTAKIIQIVCWSLLAVILIGVLVYSMISGPRDPGFSVFGFSFRDWDIFEDDDYQGSGRRYDGGTYTVPSADIKNISIEWVSGKVNIIPYSGSDISFTETCRSSIDEDEKLVYEVRGDTLVIRYWKKMNGFTFGRFNDSKDLAVSIPEGLAKKLGDLRVSTVSAEIVSNGLAAELTETESVSGNIRLSGFETGKLRSTTTSGSVEIEGKIEEIRSSSVSGSIRITDSICPSEVSISTVSGDAELRIPENDGFHVEFDKVSGDFECDFPITTSKNGGTYKNGGASFEMETVSGDLKITERS